MSIEHGNSLWPDSLSARGPECVQRTPDVDTQRGISLDSCP